VTRERRFIVGPGGPVQPPGNGMKTS
jgi:hypothetical protein